MSSVGGSFLPIIFLAVAFLCLIATPAKAVEDENDATSHEDYDRLFLGIPHDRYTLANNKSLIHLEVILCVDYHMLNRSEQCSFIKATEDCHIDDGFINYLQFAYCNFPEKLLPLALVLLFIWLVFLFVSLGVTAEDFFCPSLTAISNSLKLSQNIAGVTFLAFGNGAPDIFSAIAAITNSKDGNAGLAIGALFGAGVFVTTVVAGSVSIAQPFELAKRPFLRDTIFYVGAVFWTFYILYSGKIWTLEAVGFIVLYVGYVLVVLLGRRLYQSHIKPRQVRMIPATSIGNSGRFAESDVLVSGKPEFHNIMYGSLARYAAETYVPDSHVPSTHAPSAITEALFDSEQVVAASLLAGHGTSVNNIHVPGDGGMPNGDGLPDLDKPPISYDIDDPTRPLLGSHDEEDSYAETTCMSSCGDQIKDFFRGINPIDVENWKSKSIIGKFYEIFKSPVQLLLQLTVPLVDHTEDRHCWNRLLNCFQFAIGPLFCVLVTRSYSKPIVGNFMLWELMLAIGFLLAIVVFLTSKPNKPPVYHFLFAYIGFGISVLWIYSVANEIVNLLQMYGSVLQLSDAILGLTLLAWGNSIGDLVSDIAVAKQGYPRMAVAACFGGPLFNMLLGIGISCTIACIQQGGIFHLKVSELQYVLAAGLCVSLFFSLFYHVLRKFKATRVYGICLYVLYGGFLTIAVLTETKVIKW